MPVEPTLLVLAIAVVVNLILLLGVILSGLMGRRGYSASGDANDWGIDRGLARERERQRGAAAIDVGRGRAAETGRRPPWAADPAGPARVEDPAERGGNLARLSPALSASELGSPHAYDRVVRIVSMVFILMAITIVTASGVWPTSQSAVTLLMVIAALVVIVIHDVVPTPVLGTIKFAIEGGIALVVAALLVVVTGREESPFFLAFPLVVAGAALVVSARATLVLTAWAVVAYLGSISLGPGADLGAASVSAVGVNITSLILLTYVATVIARMQRRSRDAAIRMSTIDAMTGLYNRPYFFSAVEQEIARSSRTGRAFCLLMMDLDELKVINDRYGHFVGDRALRAVSDVIRLGVRRIDIPARYGGDEFVVLLPETDPTGGYILGEKVRQGVAELVIPGTEVRTSLSVGLVSYPMDGRTADELMISADRAMYASKRLGKNRVTGPEVAPAGEADAPV